VAAAHLFFRAPRAPASERGLPHEQGDRLRRLVGQLLHGVGRGTQAAVVEVRLRREPWARGAATAALSLLNALTFVALTFDADLVDVLGRPARWGELAQQPWTSFTVMVTGALERRVGSSTSSRSTCCRVSPPAWRR
jgi:hypothetical protein